MNGHFQTLVKMSKISYLKLNMQYLKLFVPHFDRINFSLQCLHIRKKIHTIYLGSTQDFTILHSKQQTQQTYGVGKGRVFDDNRIQGS